MDHDDHIDMFYGAERISKDILYRFLKTIQQFQWKLYLHYKGYNDQDDLRNKSENEIVEILCNSEGYFSIIDNLNRAYILKINDRIDLQKEPDAGPSTRFSEINIDSHRNQRKGIDELRYFMKELCIGTNAQLAITYHSHEGISQKWYDFLQSRLNSFIPYGFGFIMDSDLYEKLNKASNLIIDKHYQPEKIDGYVFWEWKS